MKKAFSFVLIGILLLCSCGTKNSEEYVDKRAYDECRAWYLNYVSDTANLQTNVLSGYSNDSAMYNLYYNAMRRRVAYRYIERLNKNPNDALAFDGFFRLVYRNSIIRNSGCLIGNNSFLDQMEIYREKIQ